MRTRLASGLALGVALALSVVHAQAPRLNVVFILADDLGWGEVGVYGQEKIPTPHIDRLAAQGMRFTRHYSGAPVCAPARAVLMTGRHMGHVEIRGNIQAHTRLPQFTEGQYPLSAGAVTIAQVFRDAGYATGAMGKWGLGPVGSTGDPNRKGFDLFFGYNDQAVAHSSYPPHVWRNADAPAEGPRGALPGRVGPHAVSRRQQLSAASPPRAAYAAMIAELDDHVGRVLAAIARAGIADRTLLVFTSDNGTTHRASVSWLSSRGRGRSMTSPATRTKPTISPPAGPNW